MPRHEFRTIEEFVQRLEADVIVYKERVQNAKTIARENYYLGMEVRTSMFLDILRNSNIGIVSPLVFTEEERTELYDIMQNQPSWNDVCESIMNKVKP